MKRVSVWLHGLLSTHLGRITLWGLAVVILALAANVAGIYFIGNVTRWELWLKHASGYFLAWRLCVYGATGYGWMWMRHRVLARDGTGQAKRQMLRAELAGVLALVVLEVSTFMSAR